MKRTKLFFIALVLCFINSTCLAQTAEHKTYDYITIISDVFKASSIYVSYNGVGYDEIKLAKPQGLFDCNEAIKIVKKYEKEGYELQSNNLNTNPAYIYFLMRREHKE